MEADEPVNLPFLTGCFLLVRRNLLERVGGFDPRFFVYGEDVDLSRCLHGQGATDLLPSVEVVHAFRSELEPTISRFGLLLMGYARYFAKWGWWRDQERRLINSQALARLNTDGLAARKPHL